MPTVGPMIIPCPKCGARNRVVQGRSGAHCGRCNASLPSDSPVALTDQNFQQLVLASRTPVLVDIWAPWCGPCRMLAPTIDQLARRWAGKLVVGKLNSDENPRVAGSLNVMGIPTLLVFKDGKVVARQSGVMGLDALESWLRQAGVA